MYIHLDPLVYTRPGGIECVYTSSAERVYTLGQQVGLHFEDFDLPFVQEVSNGRRPNQIFQRPRGRTKEAG